MCCGFRQLANTIAGMMHMTEKLVSCFAVASVITCFVFTTVCMIALGIGIGYNYCIGDTKAEGKQPSEEERRFNMRRPAFVPRTGNITANATDLRNFLKTGAIMPISKKLAAESEERESKLDLKDVELDASTDILEGTFTFGVPSSKSFEETTTPEMSTQRTFIVENDRNTKMW